MEPSPEIAPFSGHSNDADPFIAKDGRFLFFMSNRPLNRADERPKGDSDIWVMERQSNGTWGSPKNAGEPVNSSANEFYPRADDAGTLYFGSDRPGGRRWSGHLALPPRSERPISPSRESRPSRELHRR
jgi:WD40-like Beta Propeller Repeat